MKWRADFQSGSRVLKKFDELFLCIPMACNIESNNLNENDKH